MNSTSFVVGEKVRIEAQSDAGTNQIVAEVVGPSKYDSSISDNYSGASTVLAINTNDKLKKTSLFNDIN